MKSLNSLGLAVVMAFTAACGNAEPGDPGDNGGSAGAAGGENGGSGGSGGSNNLPFDSSDIQLNDVSVLFPLPATNAERDKGLLSLSSKGSRGVLMPAATYTSVGEISSTQVGSTGIIGSGRAAYKDLRVVAARVDPCFASLELPADGEGCDNQLRLVVQEVLDGRTSDAALHLFYSISRDELLELVKSIGGLRQSLEPGKDLGKLQPHPIMVEQGLSGSMSAGVRSAILAHAGEQNLIRVTRMTEVNGPFWDFSGFDIEGVKATPMQIPTLPAGNDAKQEFVRDFSDFIQGHAEPPSGSEDDFMVLMNPPDAQALGADEQQAKWSSLLRVESPSAHSPKTVDCVTCHVATPATKLVVEPLLGLAQKLDAKLAPTFESDSQLINVHAFSYADKQVGINQRTVNETAAVVDYLSTQDFGSK